MKTVVSSCLTCRAVVVTCGSRSCHLRASPAIEHHPACPALSCSSDTAGALATPIAGAGSAVNCRHSFCDPNGRLAVAATAGSLHQSTSSTRPIINSSKPLAASPTPCFRNGHVSDEALFCKTRHMGRAW